MRYGKFLEENGTIGLVAPSFGAATEPYYSRYVNAKKILEDKGYSFKLGPNCELGVGIGISNTPEKCAKELMDFYTDRESDVLISMGGGELMCETIEKVDFDLIKNADPKWYMGYSDNTNFTFLLTTLCDTASIYGYCFGTLGMTDWDKSVVDNFNCICGKALKVKGYDKWEKNSIDEKEFPLASFNLDTDKILVKYPDKDVKFSGRLIGGCLDCLVNLCGTKFDKVSDFAERYKEDGIVWFIESCDLNLFSIRRALWELKNASWFKYTKGFIFGRPLTDNGASYMGLDQHSAVTGILGEFNVPIIMDADLGHLPPTIPVICGSYANVEVSGNDISISYELR